LAASSRTGSIRAPGGAGPLGRQLGVGLGEFPDFGIGLGELPPGLLVLPAGLAGTGVLDQGLPALDEVFAFLYAACGAVALGAAQIAAKVKAVELVFEGIDAALERVAFGAEQGASRESDFGVLVGAGGGLPPPAFLEAVFGLGDELRELQSPVGSKSGLGVVLSEFLLRGGQFGPDLGEAPFQLNGGGVGGDIEGVGLLELPFELLEEDGGAVPLLIEFLRQGLAFPGLADLVEGLVVHFQEFFFSGLGDVRVDPDPLGLGADGLGGGGDIGGIGGGSAGRGRFLGRQRTGEGQKEQDRKNTFRRPVRAGDSPMGHGPLQLYELHDTNRSV
jgi:hypothetical protein